MDNLVDIIAIDGTDFAIIDTLIYENVKYIYAVSNNDDNDIVLLEESEKDGEPWIKSVDDDNKIKILVSLFAKRFQ